MTRLMIVLMQFGAVFGFVAVLCLLFAYVAS